MANSFVATILRVDNLDYGSTPKMIVFSPDCSVEQCLDYPGLNSLIRIRNERPQHDYYAIETYTDIQDVINGATFGYKSYVAMLTQASTAAPKNSLLNQQAPEISLPDTSEIGRAHV